MCVIYDVWYVSSSGQGGQLPPFGKLDSINECSWATFRSRCLGTCYGLAHRDLFGAKELVATVWVVRNRVAL